MSARTFVVRTFGCRANQADTAEISARLKECDWTETKKAEDAKVCIVNTCTVTHRADADARKIMKNIRRKNPEAILVVTGCYATREEKISDADLVVSNNDKKHIARIIADFVGDSPPPQNAIKHGGGIIFGRSRAFLKAQDGCDAHCAYCIIPSVRGKSRSIPSEEIFKSAKTISDKGYAEIVLTGIHLGRYGEDLGGENFPELLKKLLKIQTLKRIRISSVEPLEITDELIALVADNPERIATHFHIPLQSASDKILKSMGRPYTAEQYERLMETIHRRIPQAAIGADIIAGFPGETDADFLKTYRFAESAFFAYLHIFRFSARPGTKAADMTDKVEEKIAKERSKALRDLSRELNYRFRQSQSDALHYGVMLSGGTALTGNYIKVKLLNETGESFFPLRITSLNRAATFGEAMDVPTPGV